jgi:hypothetical protein
MNKLKVQRKQKKESAVPADFLPLAAETRTHVTTAVMCRHLSMAEQTARLWACAETFPDGLRPIRVNGRLRWPVTGICKVLGVQQSKAVSVDRGSTAHLITATPLLGKTWASRSTAHTQKHGPRKGSSEDLDGRIPEDLGRMLSRQDNEVFGKLVARAAKAGVTLNAMCDDFGTKVYVVSRWSLTLQLDDLEAVATWLDRVTGEKP